LRELRTLIVDELSMLPADFFELINMYKLFARNLHYRILTYIRCYDDIKLQFPQFMAEQERNKTNTREIVDQFHSIIEPHYPPVII
jgi:hypothetical protein